MTQYSAQSAVLGFPSWTVQMGVLRQDDYRPVAVALQMVLEVGITQMWDRLFVIHPQATQLQEMTVTALSEICANYVVDQNGQGTKWK
eukprot:12402863-Karenia_brevis.AAC.1